MRHPCVAGQFYPKSAQSLERAVSEYLNVKVEKKEQAVAIIAPH
ncbi:MAG: AmmeMemoRadiSam system protein B, partial [Deltaproteobacteria bacterium]|nr:AmmeMemoRadiSam system protein B [Deltaproteobacteria bacterium]